MTEPETDTHKMTIQEHIDEFYQQGFTLLRNVLTEEHVDELRAAFENVFRTVTPEEDGYGAMLRTKMFERGEIFERLLEQEPTVDIAEAVLGANCHMFSNNAIYTVPGTGIDVWHVDEDLFFPLPDGVDFDSRIQMPCFLFTSMYYLTDVTEDMGPTQLVPGSHRSGQHPPSPTETPYYKGQGPVTILAKKGDVLLFSGQTWHRGAKNESADKVRMVQQVTYGRRWVSQRFYPFINYKMPQEIIDRAADNPRRKRLLGLHPRGPYG